MDQKTEANKEEIQKSLKDVGLEAIEPMIISLTGLIQQIRLKNLKFELPRI